MVDEQKPKNIRIWTPMEEQFLKENYKYYTSQELANGLKRSKLSVSHKLNRLDLHSPKSVWIKQVLGKKHHHYKDGIGGYRKFRKNACEICGISKNIEVHHKDDNRHNNIPNNLITVCRKHHMKLDNRFGNLNQYSKKDYSKQISSKCKICGRFSKGGHNHV